MSSMCHVTLIGRLTHDPEEKVSGTTGATFTKLRLAWNHKKDEPGYIDATVFGKTAEVAAKYLHKGSHICLAGSRLEWRQYEHKDGGMRTAYSLVGGDLIMLGKKDEGGPEIVQPAATQAALDADIPF